MSLLYSGYLTDIGNSSTFEKTISAGNSYLTFRFMWDEANQEQYDIMARALKSRAEADSLLKDNQIRRDYDWIDWYLSLPKTINGIISYLEEGGEYPQSLQKADVAQRALLMHERQIEAKELYKYRQLYLDQLVWNVRITDAEGYEATGVVYSGGWIANQNLSWSVRFNTPLAKVGFSDLDKVEIIIEDKTA